MTRKLVAGHGNVVIDHSRAQMILWDKCDFTIINHFYEICNHLTCLISGKLDKIRLLKNKYYSKTITPIELEELQWLEQRNENHSNELNKYIDLLESSIYNYKHSDKKNGFELLGSSRKVEPQTICIRENTLVNPALVIYAKQIANTSVEEFRYIASGTGFLPTTPEQNKLQAENSRLDIFINGGFRSPKGDVVREGVIFPPGLDDALITEFGSFTSPTQGIGQMQWRNVIDDPQEQIDHDQGNTFYSIAHVTVLQINYME